MYLYSAGKRVECYIGWLHRRYENEGELLDYSVQPVRATTNLWTPDRWSFSALSCYLWDMIRPLKKIPLLISRGTSGSRKLKLCVRAGEKCSWTYHPNPEATLSLSFRSLLTVSILPCHASLASKPEDSIILECSNLSNIPKQTLPIVESHLSPPLVPSQTSSWGSSV